MGLCSSRVQGWRRDPFLLCSQHGAFCSTCGNTTRKRCYATQGCRVLTRGQDEDEEQGVVADGDAGAGRAARGTQKAGPEVLQCWDEAASNSPFRSE